MPLIVFSMISLIDINGNVSAVLKTIDDNKFLFANEIIRACSFRKNKEPDLASNVPLRLIEHKYAHYAYKSRNTGTNVCE